MNSRDPPDPAHPIVRRDPRSRRCSKHGVCFPVFTSSCPFLEGQYLSDGVVVRNAAQACLRCSRGGYLHGQTVWRPHSLGVRRSWALAWRRRAKLPRALLMRDFSRLDANYFGRPEGLARMLSRREHSQREGERKGFLSNICKSGKGKRDRTENRVRDRERKKNRPFNRLNPEEKAESGS